MKAATKKAWVKLPELPKTMVLDGHRVRYKRRVLGFIRSGWGRGLWVTKAPQKWGSVEPWFPPEGKSIADVAGDLEVEVCA